LCKTADSLEELGGILSKYALAGDVFMLTGDVGAGKTCFARGFIQALTGNRSLMVTSPTFLLDLSYDCIISKHRGGSNSGEQQITKIDAAVHHMDLYRVSSDQTAAGALGCVESTNSVADKAVASALGRLGIPTIFSDNITLVEWPELLFRSKHEMAPDSYVQVSITVEDHADQDSEVHHVSATNYSGYSDVDADDAELYSVNDPDTEYRRVTLNTVGARWTETAIARLKAEITQAEHQL